MEKKSGMGTRQKKRVLKQKIRESTTRTERRQATHSWRQGSREREEKTSNHPLAGSSRVEQIFRYKLKNGQIPKKERFGDKIILVME
jgi:hypothetical protein